MPRRRVRRLPADRRPAPPRRRNALAPERSRPDATRRPFERPHAPLIELGAALMQRRLLTVADCEALWMHAHDPLALVSAIVLLDPPLPAWLADGLLFALTQNDAPRGPRSRISRGLLRRWEPSTRARIHAVRVMEFAGLRRSALAAPSLHLTRERAAVLAADRLRETEAAVPRRARRRRRRAAEPPVDPVEDADAAGAAIERTVRSVRAAVAHDPWWGWAPPETLAARYDAAVERAKDDDAFVKIVGQILGFPR